MIVKLLYYALLLSFIANIKLVSAAVNATCKENCCAHLAKRPAQTFTFYQNTGRFTGGRGSYAINTKTYAGKGNGYLNPAY